MEPDARVEIGRVSSVNPARHEVRVKPYPAHTRQLNALQTAWLAGPGAAPMRVRIEEARLDRGMFILRLSAGVPRDTVRAFDHGTLWVAGDTLVPPDPEDWTVHDLIGLAVLHRDDGVLLGTVTDALEAPANDVITVTREDQTRFLLPVVPEVIHAVDFDAQQIEVGDIAPFAVDDAN